MVLPGVRHFVGQPYLRVIVLIIGIVSMYGALNSNLTAAIKTSFSMARDRLLPGSFARIGGREVPPAAVALTFVGAGFLVFLTIETIAILASLAFLGLFAFVHASVVALRRGERRSAPGFRVPLVPAVPMAAIALNLALGALLWNYPARSDAPLPPGTLAILLGGVWLAMGLAYHWLGGRRAAGSQAPTASAAEVRDILATSEDHVELDRYRVFLPLREFEDEALVELGARIARAKNAELSLLHVVEIPRNLPPKAIRFRYVDDRIRGLQRLARIGEHMGVDTRPVVKIGHKVYEIILDTIREEAVNLLVMGWRGERIEGHLLDPVGVGGAAREGGRVLAHDPRDVPGRPSEVRPRPGRGSDRQVGEVRGPHLAKGDVSREAVRVFLRDWRADSSDERHVDGLDASHSGDRGQGLLEQVGASGGIPHDRHRENCLQAEGHRLLAQVAEGAAERGADARSNRLEVRIGILGHDAERDGHGSHAAPYGPVNEQAGQRYATD